MFKKLSLKTGKCTLQLWINLSVAAGRQRLGCGAHRLSTSGARTKRFNHCIELTIDAQLMLTATVCLWRLTCWFQPPWTIFSEGPMLLLSLCCTLSSSALPGSLPQHPHSDEPLAHPTILGLQVYSGQIKESLFSDSVGAKVPTGPYACPIDTCHSSSVGRRLLGGPRLGRSHIVWRGFELLGFASLSCSSPAQDPKQVT